MYRTHKTTFHASQTTIQKLFDVRRICGVIWNDCLELARYWYRLGNRWISQTELQTQTKGHYPLHSQTVQAVVHRYTQARDGAKEARQKGGNNRYPWRRKFVFNPKWVDKAFVLEGNKLTLSMGTWQRKRQTPLVLTLPSVPEGDVKEVELVFDGRRWHACLSYENGIVANEKTNGVTASNDPGEIHAIASVTEKGDSVIITGREIRSIHRLRNKKLKEIQALMNQCKKGSRKWRRYNRARKFVLSKSENQLKNALHQATHLFVQWCLDHDVKHIALGNPAGVEKNTKKKKRLRRAERQKMSNWSYSKLYDYLQYKLASHGISTEKVPEHYTSQTCPVCGNRKKTSKRTYACTCGYKKHRDIHGACNILTKHLHGRFVELHTQTPTFLRPVSLA